jgi:hypothetical protein
MQPAMSFEELISDLTEDFQSKGEASSIARVRMIGIVFARPNSPLARREILPQLNDWHHRSGNHINFYFAGYTYYHPITSEYLKVQIPGGKPWLYSAERFEAFRKKIEESSSWNYGGSCELLLTNARYCPTTSQAFIDFSTAVCCQLDLMENDNAIQSIERFFESIFRFAESANDEDPTWGFSDKQGIKIACSALKRFVLSLLPKKLGEDYVKMEHFAVRDVGQPSAQVSPCGIAPI